MILVMQYLFLDALNQAANAVIAQSVDAGRTLLNAQQVLEACRQQNNPGLPGNTWIQGMRVQNAHWAPDPCQAEQDAVNQLMDADEGGGGDKQATQQQGGAPAPQLANPVDPTPSEDPAIPANEFVVPEPGAHNQWIPLTDEQLQEMLWEAYKEHPVDEEMIQMILDPVKLVRMWCPWGGPGVTNLRWTFKYKPKNSKWIGKWLP